MVRKLQMPKIKLPMVLLKVIGIHLYEVPPLLRGIIFGEDCLDGACRLARATIDALIRVNVEHLGPLESILVLARVDAVYGANVNACRVLRPDAGFCNNVRHLSLSLLLDLNSKG
jgi:hypothetical protein